MSVSLIVPVYNVQDFLWQCVDSILGQTYSDLKLILVDDGSSDRSGIICDDYARCDSRVTVIHQKNAGPGSARNSALAILDPESYVMFVDADDYLTTNAIEQCVNVIELYETDMVICNYTSIMKDTGEFCSHIIPLSGLLSFHDIIRFINGHNDLGKSSFIGPSYRRLLRGRIIQENNIRFPDNEYLAEDIVFMAKYFKSCNSFFALDEALYFRRHHTQNLSAGFEGIPVRAMLLGHEAYKILLSDASAADNAKLDNQFINNMIGSIVRLYHPRLSFTSREKSLKIKQILNSSEFRRVLKGYKVKEGHSKLLALSIRLRCIPLIKLVANTRARKRYKVE